MFYRRNAQVTAWGLAGLMPTPSGADAATRGTAAQFPALASGKAKGGNFERFEDAAALGFFPRSEAGYLAYLTYNQLGVLDGALKPYPDYVAWHIAADKAYAVGTRQCGANVPPCTAEQMQLQGYETLRAAARRHGWDATVLASAETRFRDDFARLVARIGAAGQGVANVPIVEPPEPATVPLPPPRQGMIPKSWVISDTTDEWGERTLIYQQPGGQRIVLSGGGTGKPLPTQDVLVLLIEPLPRWMPEADAVGQLVGWVVETRKNLKGPGIVGEKWETTLGPVHRWAGWVRFADQTPGPVIRDGRPGWTWVATMNAPADVRSALERAAEAPPPARYGFGSVAPPASVTKAPEPSDGYPATHTPAPSPTPTPMPSPTPSTGSGGGGGGDQIATTMPVPTSSAGASWPLLLGAGVALYFAARRR